MRTLGIGIEFEATSVELGQAAICTCSDLNCCKQITSKRIRTMHANQQPQSLPAVGSMHSVLSTAIPRPASPVSRNAPNALHERFLKALVGKLAGALRTDALPTIPARWSPEVQSAQELSALCDRAPSGNVQAMLITQYGRCSPDVSMQGVISATNVILRPWPAI